MFELIFDEIVDADIYEAAQWYGERSLGLDDKFLDEIERTLNYIQNNPMQYSRIGSGLQRAKN